MPFTENFAEFLQVRDFATTAVWSVGSTPVNLIFDSEYSEAQLGLIAGIEGARMVAFVSASSMATVARGQTLTMGGLTYTIRGIQPDGTGMIVLVLEEDETGVTSVIAVYGTDLEAIGVSASAPASVNQTKIQTGLNVGGTVRLTTPGVYDVTSDTFTYPAGTRLILGIGVRFSVATVEQGLSSLPLIGRDGAIMAVDFGVSPSAGAVINTAGLRNAIAAAISNDAGKVVLPAGDIYLDNTTPIDITEIYGTALAGDLPLTLSYTEGITIEGQGRLSTRLRCTSGGTLFRVYATTQNLMGQWFKNLSIFGPNSAPVTKSSCGVSSGSNVVTLANTSDLSVGMWVYDHKNGYFPIGSYISAITSNVSVTISSKTTASPPVQQNQNASGSDASATLTFYIDSCAIQRGGVSSGFSNILQNGGLEHVGIYDFFTALRCDDNSQLYLRDIWSSGNEYFVEGWYNSDNWTFDFCYLQGTRFARGITGTTTNSSSTISSLVFDPGTMPGQDGTYIRPGSKVSNWTTPSGFVGTERVVSTTSTTAVMSANHAGSGGGASKTLTFHRGVGVSIAAGPWRPAYNGSLGTPNNILFTNSNIGQGMEKAFECGVDGAKPITFSRSYIEGLHQLASHSFPAGGGAVIIVCEQCHFSTMDNAQGRGFVECLATGGSPNPSVTYRNCDSDGTMSRPWFFMNNPSSNNVLLDIDNCQLSPAATQNVYSDGTFPLITGWYNKNGTRFCMGGGPGQAGGVHVATATGAYTSQWQPRGFRRFEWTLSGNTSVPIQATNTFVGLEDGDLITFKLTQNGTGGYTMTFDATYFFKSDGATALGTAGVIAPGTANKVLSITFVVNLGQKRFIRCDGNGEAWT